VSGVMVRVLGPVEIERNGRFVSTRSRSRRKALAMLAVQRDADVSLDQLTEVMHATPAAVRTIVSRLRHDLGAEMVRTTSTGYSIDAQRCDATVAECLLAQARTDRPGRAVDLVAEALSYWRGRAFGEFAEEAWAEAEAARLDELHLTACEEYADLLIDADRYDEAIAVLKRHVLTCPLRDRPRRSLMIALDKVGRTAEALREFQDYRRFLAEEVGMGPSPATRDVERRIYEGETPLVGRRRWPTETHDLHTTDLDAIGLALARLLLHEGHCELAARAMGSCGSAPTQEDQVAALLQEIDDVLGRPRRQQLLADGRSCGRRELYRELWEAAQPLLNEDGRMRMDPSAGSAT
jgi:DNA-binding SARP family transcriptional activator